MKSLKRILHFVKPYWKESVLALVLLVGLAASDLLIPRLTQRVVDAGIAQQDMRVVLTTSVMMLGAAVVSAAFAVANTVLSVRVGQNMSADLRSSLVRKVQTFSFGNLDRIPTGQLLVRATSDVNQVQMVVTMSLRILTRAPMWMVGSIIMLILTSPRLALMMFRDTGR